LDKADGWDCSVEAARAGAAHSCVYHGHPSTRADEISAAEQEAKAATQVAAAQTVALAPRSDRETALLVTQLLGPDPSVGELGHTIAERAAGNPFFAEEIVRELARRGVLRGEPGAHLSMAEVAEVRVPLELDLKDSRDNQPTAPSPSSWG
jgi:hypothetical protein